MKVTKSPWLKELKRKHRLRELWDDYSDSIVIIGGGISGIATAYYLLTQTKYSVTLVEANRIAEGATGHNAGQVVDYFERPFKDMIKEFGFEMAANGVRDVQSAWKLVEDIIEDLNLKIDFAKFIGYDGYTDFEDLTDTLELKYLYTKGNLRTDKIYVANDYRRIKDIPQKYDGLYELAPRSQILKKLETKNKKFFAVSECQKACLNSALFCEEVVSKLIDRFPIRFTLFENTSINRLILDKKKCFMVTRNNLTITANKVILATNGFESFKIINTNGRSVTYKFNQMVKGLVGYMVGYIDEPKLKPMAIKYHDEDERTVNQEYFYLTRRKYLGKNLVCIGGPDFFIGNRAKYAAKALFARKAKDEIFNFLQKNFANVKESLRFNFRWHGLMGYTKNRIRLVGVEPCNPNLLYNLGCNGIGILPSIFGGYKIAQIITKKKQFKSIFDPLDKRIKKLPNKPKS